MSQLSESRSKTMKMKKGKQSMRQQSSSTMRLEMIKSENAYLKEGGTEALCMKYLPPEFNFSKPGPKSDAGGGAGPAVTTAISTNPSTYTQGRRLQCDLWELLHTSAILIQIILFLTLVIIAYYFLGVREKSSLPGILMIILINLFWSLLLGLILLMYIMHVVEIYPSFPWYLTEIGVAAMFILANFVVTVCMSIFFTVTLINACFNIQIYILSIYGKLRSFCDLHQLISPFSLVVIVRYYNFRKHYPPQYNNDASHEYARQMMNMFKTNRK